MLRVDAPNVVIEAVKQAEDQGPGGATRTGETAGPGANGWVVRLYECHGASVNAALCPGFPIEEAAEINLMEEVLAPLQVRENTIRLHFCPFEVKTVRLTQAIWQPEPRFSGTCPSLFQSSSHREP